MSHSTSPHRTASALGATALLGLVLAAPAMASQDAGTDGPAPDSTTAVSGSINGLERSLREGNTDGTHRQRRDGGSAHPDSYRTSQDAPQPSTPTVVAMDDDAIEYLQVGAGVLAGILVAGASAVVISRRHDSGLKPA